MGTVQLERPGTGHLRSFPMSEKPQTSLGCVLRDADEPASGPMSLIKAFTH